MIDYCIATNSDTRVEAFYIEDDGIVQHTWQLTAGDKTSWNKGGPLYGTNPQGGGSNQNLTNAIRVQATTDDKGQIQVIACTQDFKYYTCYQTPGYWNGWFAITQS